MKKIDIATYQALVATATVVERDPFGEKVLALPDGLLVKIFRRKRLWSSATIYPYAARFVRNARRLTALGISTVTVLDVAYCAEAHRYLVTYRPLPGETLRGVLLDSDVNRGTLLDAAAKYIAVLHAKGVFFRSLHFGNIIVSPEDRQMGLIDVADLGFRRQPLSIRERLRNFRHMLRYAEDVSHLRDFGWAFFVTCYLKALPLSSIESTRLRDALQLLPEFSPAVAGE